MPSRQLIQENTLIQASLMPVLLPPSVQQKFLLQKLACGFPSPAESSEEARLDVNSLLVKNSNATFFFRVRGDSMKDIGLVDGSYIAVDRSLPARNGHVVVAIVNQEHTVKRLVVVDGICELHAENSNYPPIRFADQDELSVWGVVTGWVHKIPY